MSSARSRPPSGRCSRARPSPASPSSPTWPRRSPSFAAPRASSRWTPCWRATCVRPTPVPRRFAFRHPLVRQRGLRRRRPPAGGWRPTRARRPRSPCAAPRRRARPPRRAVGRPGRRGRDRAAARGRRGDGPARARGRGALVRGGSAAAARRRRRAPGRRARVAGLGAALARRARALPRDAAARRSTCCPPDASGAARRADRPLRRGRALARPPRGRAPPPHRAWDELPDRSTAAAAALQIELAVDGLYELDFAQTLAMGAAALGPRATSATGR